MGFSYNTDSTATERDYVRFRLNDIVEDAGPLPNGVNFTDEEIDMMIELEGKWQRAVAACYEALQSAWATHVSWSADGLKIDMSDVADQWEKLAEKQRKKFPGGSGGSTSGHARTVIRVDGYSQDVASSTVDDVTY